MTADELRTAARKVLALKVQPNETVDHLLARLRHAGPYGDKLRRDYLDAEEANSRLDAKSLAIAMSSIGVRKQP